MKKWFCLLLVLIILTFTFWAYQNKIYADIVDACYEAGGETITIQLEGSSFLSGYNDKYLLSKELIGGFDVISYEYTQTDEEFLLNAIINNGYITIRLKDVEDKIYASLTVSQNAHNVNINNIKQTIFINFIRHRAIPKFSLLVMGRFNGKLTTSEMKEKAIEILKRKRAIFVDGIENENLVSVSAFLPTLEERKKCEDKYINLNIALRYSDLNKCTYIWIGSPLIFEEY